MVSTKDEVQQVLSENRSLILGAQILLGFQYEAFFRPKFDELSPLLKDLELVGLTLLLATILCLIAPSSFHRISEAGEATRRQRDYTTIMLGVALGLFSLALGVDFCITTQRALGFAFSLALGAALTALALALWFGVPTMMRQDGQHRSGGSDEHLPMKEKINELLTESRIVLPGAQALLGFQFAAYLSDGFDKLPEIAQMVHTASLVAIAVAMLLLMAPAPLHRFGERGENTPRFNKIGSALVLAALVPLALGLAGELFVGFDKVLESASAAMVAAAFFLAAASLLWFVLPLGMRPRTIRPSEATAAG